MVNRRAGGLVTPAASSSRSSIRSFAATSGSSLRTSSILRALDDPASDALAELRGVLLAEHEWRVREGLV